MAEQSAIEWMESELAGNQAPQAAQWREVIAVLKHNCPARVLAILGYRVGPGVSSLSTQEMLDKRDQEIRSWHNSSGDDSAKIAEKLSDFGSRIWPLYKIESEMPWRFCGKWEEFAWRVYCAKPSPLSDRQIRRILAAEQTDIK